METYFDRNWCFLKFAWSIPVKYKYGKSVRYAFKSVLTSADSRKPERLLTEEGKEFVSRDLTGLMSLYGIHKFAFDSYQRAVSQTI